MEMFQGPRAPVTRPPASVISPSATASVTSSTAARTSTSAHASAGSPTIPTSNSNAANVTSAHPSLPESAVPTATQPHLHYYYPHTASSYTTDSATALPAAYPYGAPASYVEPGMPTWICTMISGFHRANRVWDLMSVADSSDQAVLSELLASWFQTGYHTGYYKVCTHHCHCVRITADVGCCTISHHSSWCHCLDAGAVRFAGCSTCCCDAQHSYARASAAVLERYSHAPTSSTTVAPPCCCATTPALAIV